MADFEELADLDELYGELAVRKKRTLGEWLVIGLIAALVTVLMFGAIFYTELLFVATALSFLGLTVFSLSNYEYEYLYTKEGLLINRIYSRNKRKKVARVDLDHMEVLAPLGSHWLDSYKDAEVVDFSAKDKEQKPYVMVVASRMGIKKLLLQFDEEMVENFKNRIPRKVFSD